MKRDPLSLVPRRESFTFFGPAQGLPAPRVTKLVRDDRRHDLGRHGRRRRAAGRRALRDAHGRARGSAPVGDLRDRGRRGTQAHGRGRRGRAVDARGQPLVRDRPRPAGLRGQREQPAADEGPRGRADTLGRHLRQRRAAHPERARRALRPGRGADEPPGHVARAHPARAGRRAALGGHARRRPLPPRRRALSGRPARPVHLRGLLAGGRRRRGPGGSLGRHAHGRPAPPRSRLVAGARPLVRAAGRPGAGAARDEGRGRPAGLLGGNRRRPRRDPRRPRQRRGQGAGAAGPTGGGARRAARAGPHPGDLGFDRGPRPGEAGRRALGAGPHASGVRRGPRRLAARLDGPGRRGGALGRHRPQRARALRARALERAAHQGRAPVRPGGRAARDHDSRQPYALGRNARRRSRRGGGRARGADLGPQLGARFRRRAGARRAAPSRKPPRAVGRHALRRGAARSRRAVPRLVAARSRHDALRPGRHGAVDRPGQRGPHLPRDAARRRAADAGGPPGRGSGRPHERALRRRRRPAERDGQLGADARLEGAHLDPDHRRHRAARPRARGHLRRSEGAADDRARAGDRERAPDPARHGAAVRRARRAVRVRPAHAAARGGRALPHAARGLRRGALGLGRSVPEDLHQPAGARVRVPRRGARRDRAPLGAGRAGLLRGAQPVAASVGDRARGGAGRGGRDALPARARAGAPQAGRGARGARRRSARISCPRRTSGSRS